MIENFSSEITKVSEGLLENLPSYFGDFLVLFIMVLFVVFYAIFIWKFYRFTATKNILELNLNQYNRSEHPFFEKLIASSFYLLEYIIILPFLIFFWFAVFTLFLLFLSEQPVSDILIISTIIISAIRMTSYYKEDLSKDLAKLLPFTLLAVSLLTPGFFSIERISSQIAEIPGFLNNIIYYLGFIIALEIILRFFDFLFSLFGVDEERGG